MLMIYVKLDDRVAQQLSRIADELGGIRSSIMALKDELQNLIASFDTATNAVAAEIDKLRQQIADALANPNTLTDEDKAAIESGLQAQIDRLNVLGSDPSNPIPPPPPPPPPA